jgi:Protein of unknown function (DUF2971).
LALCFTEASETYHHWRVFAAGSSGVCLEFDKTSLLRSIESVRELRSSSVKYLTITALEKANTASRDLPFVKRYPFRDEKEFRIIYEDAQTASAPKDIPIEPSALRGVVVNPWMPNAVYESVKGVILGVQGWEHLRVHRTTLVDNERWRQLGQRGIEPSNGALQPSIRARKQVKTKGRSRAARG